MNAIRSIKKPASDTRTLQLREGGCLRIAGAVLSVRRGGVMTAPADAPIDFDIENEVPWAGSCLVLSFRPGDRMLLAGVLLTFRGNVRLELLTRTRMVFGRQYMSEEEAFTPERRLYYLLQQSYAGPAEQCEEMLALLRVAARKHFPTMISWVDEAARTGNYYQAICKIRVLLDQGEGVSSVSR